jgi:hypothetical protein
MRTAFLIFGLFLLVPSTAAAVSADLAFQGTSVGTRHDSTFFESASDEPFTFDLDVTVAGPCHDAIGHLTGIFVIDGHDDGTFSLGPQLYQSDLRGGTLRVEDPATGDVVLEATLGTARIYMYGEFPGTFLEGSLTASGAREISSTCEFGELLDASRSFDIYGDVASESLPGGQWSITLDADLQEALLSAVPTGQGSWGVLKARY